MKQLLVQEKIDQIIKNDPKLCALKKVCKTVPGVGDVTANALIAMVPEMGTVNRKQIASLVGVAPHPNERGDKIGHRYMRGGRSEVKSILFMAVLSSTRSKSELGEFYKRHIDNGKNKMVALGAVMRKMIVIVNARVRDELIRLEEEKLSSNVAC